MKYLQLLGIGVIGLLVFICLNCQSDKRHFNSGPANSEAGKLEHAISDYTKAIELKPKIGINTSSISHEIPGGKGSGLVI